MRDGEDQDFTSHRPPRRQPFAYAARHAGHEPAETGRGVGLTFQQVQKYEKGTNRMGAGRLQEAARILDVALPFFFEGTDDGSYKLDSSTPSHAYINEFTASSEGLRLVKAFTRIARPAIRHRIVMLVQEIAGSAGERHAQ